MFLATQGHRSAKGNRVTIQQVAEFYAISAAHVAKVVNQLARLGFVRSIRGIGGGIELCCDPNEITVGQVIESFEGSMHLLDCVGMDGVCIIESFCKLKGVLARAEQIQQEYLNNVTLADVLPSKRQVSRISNMPS